MADYNSSLPVRTQNNGDVAAKIVDGTVTSQALAVDASGRIVTKLDDGNGNIITSQASGAQRALDVGINVAGVQVDPRLTLGAVTTAAPTYTTGTDARLSLTTAGALRVDGSGTVQPVSGTVTANQGMPNTNANGWFVRITDGTNNATVLATGEQKVAVTQLLTEDHNYGTVGANTLRAAAQIGNATGAADFNFGAASAQTLRAAALIGNATGAADFNYGTIGAQSVRAAAQLGNATGSIDYNNGATSAQTIRTAANLAVAGANVSATNPVPVTISSASPGTAIASAQTSASLAVAATANLRYTVTTGKTLSFSGAFASASGKIKVVIGIETAVASGTFTTVYVGFNSTAEPNIPFTFNTQPSVAAGVRVQAAITNLDLLAQDVYCTFEGTEN